MKKRYRLKILQITNATRDILWDMSRRCIVNDDFLEVFVCTNLVADIFKNVSALLREEFGGEKVKQHITLKVPFSYRKDISAETIAAFSFN